MTITFHQYPITPLEYLLKKGIPFKETNGELQCQCMTLSCQSVHHAGHMYIGTENGLFHCKKCGDSGNLWQFAEKFGDNLNDFGTSKAISFSKKETVKPNDSQTVVNTEYVQKLHAALPEEIRQWLIKERLLKPEIIEKAQIGYGEFYGKFWIVIPCLADNGEYILKLRKLPNDKSPGVRYIIYPRGAKHVMYGAEQLSDQPDEVVITEGELDRLVLESYGIYAVTGTGGVGTFKEEWVESFKSIKRIYICCDSDMPGEKGAVRIIKIFKKFLPDAEIYQILLPKIDGVKDITDFFKLPDYQPTKSRLDAFFDLAKVIFSESEVSVYASMQNVASKIDFTPISLTELMSKQFADTDWLVENLIPAAGIIAVSGSPASYKTWLVLDLALRLAKGDILFEKFITTQVGVLIVDEENGERLLQKRLQKLHPGFDLPVHVLSLKGFSLVVHTLKALIIFCKKNNVKLVIFDALVRIHSSDENSAMDMAQVFKLLKEFNKEGITVLFTHHNRKQGVLRSNPSQDMRGSSDILASVDCHLGIQRTDDCVIVNQTKLRQGEEMKPFKLNLINEENEIRFEFAGDVDEVQSKKTDFKEGIRDLMEQEQKPMYKKELFETLRKNGVEGGYSTFKIATQEMVENGGLFEQRGEGNKMFCSLKPFDGAQTMITEAPVPDG